MRRILRVLGIVLVLAGVGLLVRNRGESQAAGEKAEALLVQIQEESAPLEEASSLGVAAIVEIPCLNLTLPVIDQWSEENLKTAPCRYSGSLETADLVLCAHNYPTHFGNLDRIPLGEQVLVKTLDGREYPYQTAALEILEATAIEEMTASAYPLTLFSCTPGGQSRIVLRCTE